jgi:(5-formylfuran-3-yl)methyl phosphate synthase
MTQFLASVRDAAEAEIALRAGADIIDVKEPGTGALGAVDRPATRAIVKAVAGRVPVSATIGDLPMRAETIGEAVLERAACGVDYVKFGVFPEDGAETCLAAFRPLARRIRLIAVLFADRLPVFDGVAAAAEIGAAGVMVDTAGKASGALLDHLDLAAVASLVARARAQGLITGLAGSLHAGIVPELLALAPDLLGFRRALCRGSRASTLDPVSCAAIRALIPEARALFAVASKARLPGVAVAAAC